MVNRALPMHREKYSEKKLQLPPLAAFDFETEGLGGKFLVAAIWTSDDYRELFTSIEDFFEWVINHPQYRYLAHNAVGYEFAYLAPLICGYFANNSDIDISPTIQGDTRIVQFRIVHTDEENRTRRGKPTKTIIDIRDTLCLFNMSLAKVAEAFCPELPKLKANINFEKESWDINNPAHVEYVYRDCEIVLKAYERHANNVREAFGCPLGVTAGSTALKAFRATIPEGHVYYRTNKDAESFIRKAYYGGLVLPGHSIGEWGAIGSVDVNGAYAYQQKSHRYPVGTPFATHSYHSSYLGFYRVMANVPPCVYDELGFNPVPRKDKSGLCWPTGTFETYLSSPEIEYAREKGCTIDIICGYVFPRQEEIFDEFIQKCQDMEVFDNFRYKPSVKQIRNSGYGKFGAKESHKTIKFSKVPLEGYYPVTIEETNERIEGLYVGDEISEADYMLPHWAAMITAYERLYLMRFMEEAYQRGAKNVYCDTDSIKCDLSVLVGMVADGTIPVGQNYGQFKVEEVCTSFIMLGSKCFYGDVDGHPDKPLIKAKGIPRGKADKQFYIDALNNKREQAEFVSVKSVMSIIKEKSSVKPIRRVRKITDIRNSYAWQVTQDGRLYPRGYPLEKEELALTG